MGTPPHDDRLYEFKSYLNETERLGLETLAEIHEAASERERARWRETLGEWKIDAREMLGGRIRDKHSWRRIVFLFEDCKQGIEDGEEILDPDLPGYVVERMSPELLAAEVASDPQHRIPRWVDDTDLPIAVTYQRHLELQKLLTEMSARFMKEWKSERDDRVLVEWEDGVLKAMTPHLHVDLEWEKIRFMLADMMKSFERGETLRAPSGRIDLWYSGEEMVHGLEKSGPSRLNHFRPRKNPVSRRKIPAGSIKKPELNPINGRVARIHGISTVANVDGGCQFRRV